MVKNEKGGKNQKRMGRKFVNAPRSNYLRKADPNEPAEIYACVSKCLGNGMAHAINTYGTNILIHIRNKFRGRGKRDNLLAPGTVILAGERTFESVREGKMKNCDLLEVYSETDAKRLDNETSVDFSAFKDMRGFEKKELGPEAELGFSIQAKHDSTVDDEIEEAVKLNAIKTGNDGSSETISSNSIDDDIFYDI